MTKNYFNSQGTEIFPFSYFENPWLECDLVIKDNKDIQVEPYLHLFMGQVSLPDLAN